MTNPTSNQTTVASYERIAADYAASTAGIPDGVTAAGIRRLLDDATRPGEAPSVLELGSGPGWDADFVEELGARVRRTDVTRAFCDLQAERGRAVDVLDAITDAYTDDDHPAYDAVLALCVLLHVDRASTPGVLRKVHDALRPGGGFLVSVREGELWEHGESGNAYHVTFWQRPALDDALRAAGLEPTWHARSLSDDEAWLTVLATAGPRTGQNELVPTLEEVR